MKRLYRQQHLVDFMAVVMQFTRIKIKWSFFSDEAPDLKRACWAFPLAGWLLGFIAGGLGQILILMNLPVILGCAIAIAFCIYLSGAYHEDGLADMADGFGAGGDCRRISNIIHDVWGVSFELGNYCSYTPSFQFSRNWTLAFCNNGLGSGRWKRLRND